MDHHDEQGPHIPIRGSIRLSKLPMPRAVPSTDNLKLSAPSPTVPTIHHDDLRKASHIPRPMGSTTPLGENVNQSIRSRYGWTEKSAKPRNQSPVRDALRDVHTSAIETTPPSSNSDAPLFEAGNENPTAGIKDTKRPQQVSPTPSPTNLRPDSPTKRPFRPPGRMSPTKDMAVLPPVVSPGEIYTPPKAFVKGQRSRIAKLPREPKRATSSIFDARAKEPSGGPPSKYSAQTMKLKPTYEDKTAPSPSLTAVPSLSAIFKEPPPSTKPSGKLAISGVESPSALLKPRSRGENSIAPSTPPKETTKTKKKMAVQRDSAVTVVKDSGDTSSPKSSANLRETIAKAKAARRKARESTGTANTPSTGTSTGPSSFFDEEMSLGGENKGLLQKRIQQAVTSGHLNIAAMNLKQIPAEVMKMYDPESSTTNWAEMVDLVKFNAADNEIEELDETFFPDLDELQLGEDGEKSYFFGGVESLDLHRNHLQRIPPGLRTLGRLHTLNLSGNRLTNDVFGIITQIPNLKELILADNLLEGTLNLNSCDNEPTRYLECLEVLDLHGNALESLGDLALLHLRSLKVLNLAGNRFSSLDELPNELTELNVSKNRFKGILLPENTFCHDLRSLDASYNKLEKLSSDDELRFSNLRSLILTSNKIANLPSLTISKQLLMLDVAENQLETIPSDLSQLENLKSADFANNNIRLIPAEVATMANLTSLNLVGNPLREKKYLKMSIAELKVDLEKKLDVPQADNVPSDATTLSTSTSTSQYLYIPSNGNLDVSSHSLTTIPISEIDLSSSVQTLKLSNNDLSSFPAEVLSHPSIKYSLQSLDLSHNPQLHPTEYLTSELFLPNLKSLYIVSTGLTSLDALTTYLRAPELREINISCHRLEGRVPWVRAWWPKVTTLLATDNWFTSIDAEGVRGLEVLDIRNNEIESLPPKLGLLGNLPDQKAKVEGRLRVLEVSGNRFRVPRLAVVEKGTEAVLKDLRRMVKTEEMTEEWRDAM